MGLNRLESSDPLSSADLFKKMDNVSYCFAEASLIPVVQNLDYLLSERRSSKAEGNS